MNQQTFDKLLHFVAPSLRERVVVAGGYAADATKAGDIDLWVLSSIAPLTEGILLTHLDHLGVDYDPGPSAHYAGRHLVASIENGYEGKRIQILTTEYSTAQALVGSFDISTHAIAKRIVGQREGHDVMQVAFGKGWTTTSETPRVLRFTTPDETLYRLMKITERYGTKPAESDLAQFNVLAEAA